MFEVDGTIQPTARGLRMAVSAGTTGDAVPVLTAGARVKGEYRCEGCGYGVTIFRQLPLCPMCGSSSWQNVDRSPFTSATAGRPFDGLGVDLRGSEGASDVQGDLEILAGPDDVRANG